MDDIISMVDIKTQLEECISKTNTTIQRWKEVNGTSPNSIISEDAKSIILNLIKRQLVVNKIDFSRFRKIFRLTINENKYISSIIIADKSFYHFRVEYIINEIDRVSSMINYKSLEPTDKVKQVIDNKELISFKSIQSINF